jgi:MFS family permease
MAITYMLLSTLQADTSTLGYILRIAPLGIGVGMFNSPNNSAIMGAVSRKRLGIASGFIAMTRTLGQTTGVAVIGTIFATQAAAYAGLAVSAELDTVPPAALVQGMQDAVIIVGVLMFVAAAISAIGLWKKWENKPAGETQQAQVIPQEPA